MRIARRPLAFLAPLSLLAATSCQIPATEVPPDVATPPSTQPEAPKGESPAAAEAPPAAPKTSAFTPPATKDGEDGWSTYVDPPQYDAKSVGGVFPGASSPEAAVVHYLASRVRHDERYREVLTKECSPKCARKLAEHDQWTFRAFRLVSKTPTSGGGIWIKVWFEIEYKGEVDGGTDEFTVVEEGGEYRIAEVPT